MKKFTRNFLSGGYRSFLHILRSFALGLVALVGVHAAANGQSCDPPPGTVHFYADSITPCYNGTNTYEVTVSVMGFENVDTLNLDLAFDNSFWNFESAVVIEPVFKQTNTNSTNGSSNTPMTISDAGGGVINFSWAENISRGTIPASLDAPSVFAKLKFSIKGFPNNGLASYSNPLEWDKGANHVGYCIGSTNFYPWNNVAWHDGLIKTTKSAEAVTVTVVPETVPCAGMKATATVNPPMGAGYSYSFNGVNTWVKYEDGGNTADLYPGSHTVYVMDENKCMVKKDFVLKAAGEVTHSTSVENESCDHLGEITINISNPAVPVTEYWTVPETAYLAGKPFAATYKSTQNKTLVPAGIWWTAAVTECGETAWVRDSVAKGASFDWDGDVTVDQASCGMGGEYVVAVIDSLTDSTAITVQLIDVVNSVLVMDTTWIRPTPGDDVNDTLVLMDIAPGTYEVRVTDGGDCTGAKLFDILPADDITFDIAHTDVACSNTDGKLWVTNVDGILVSALTETYGLYISGSYKDGNGDLMTVKDTIWDVNDTIKDLPAGVYEAYLFTVPAEDSMGCVVAYDGINGNEIVLFDNGIVQFAKHKEDVTCAGEDDGKIWITNVERNCETCNEDAYYVARLIDTVGGGSTVIYDWTPVANVATEATTDFENLPPAGYMIEVKDTADGDACVAFKFEMITAPDSLYFMVDTIVPPSCYYGNDGSVRVLIKGGTPPYAYSINTAPNWTDGTAFNLEQGQEYVLMIRDKWGTNEPYCTFSDTITVPALDPLIINAFEATAIVCDGDGAKIGVELVSYTHWADSVADYKYYQTASRVSFTDPFMPDPDEVRDVATVFTPSTNGTNGTSFNPGKYYVYAIDKFGCVAEDSITVDGVDKLAIDSVVVNDAKCHDTWSGDLTIYVKEGSGIVDSVYYYRYANNYDVLDNDPDGLRHDWRAFDYDVVKDKSEYIAMSAMTAGKWYVQIKDDCTDTIVGPVIVKDWGPIVLDDKGVNVTNATCNGTANGTISVDAGAVTGGAGEPYYYTLLNYPDNSIVSVTIDKKKVKYEEVAVPNFTNLPAGHYRVIAYDDFGRDQDPTMCPPDTSIMFTVNEPCPIEVQAEVKHVSCAGAQNGLVYLTMSGGLGGTYGYPSGHKSDCSDPKGNKNDGNHYYVTVNNITNPGLSFTRMVEDNIDTLVFQTAGGEFDIFVTDELNKGDMEACYADTTVVVYEPTPWTFKDIITHPSDCDVKDGKIQVVVEGGFLDSAMWSYPIGPDTVPGMAVVIVEGGDSTWIYPGTGPFNSFWSGDTLLVSDSATYGETYELIVMNSVSALDAKGHKLAAPQCPGKHVVTMENFIPFSMDLEAGCVTCNGDENGPLTIKNITGGFANAYQLQFVSTDSVYQPENEDKWWPKVTKASDWLNSSDSVVYDKLAAGDYYIYLRDSSDYTLHKCCRPFPFTICDQPELILDSVVRIQNNVCAGDSTGAFEIHAHGGLPPYKYWYSRTPFAQDTFLYPGIPDTSLFVTASVMDNLPSGAYVGWVMDANGCIIGCDVNEDGLPKDGQRVIIRDAGALVYDDYTVMGGGCYLNPVDVVYHNVIGGSGDSITVMVKGTAIDMDTVTMWEMSYDFAYTPGQDITLTDVPPGNYSVMLETNMDCPSQGDTLIVEPGERFIVTMEPTGGKGCVGDNAIWVRLKTEGGVAPYKYVIYDAEGVVVRDTNVIQDHLLAVGENYTVEAIDAGGCVVSDQLDIKVPQEVTFSVKDVTCYGEAKASAKVEVKGTPGRQFKVKWDEFEGDITTTSGESAFFTLPDSATSVFIPLSQLFNYDDTNTDDVHYEFWVEDGQGCISGVDTITFDMIDGPLQVVNVNKVTGDCTSELAFQIAGGTAPYAVYVDNVLVEDSIGFFKTISLTLGGGSHEVWVTDKHECAKADTIVLDYGMQIFDTVYAGANDTAYYAVLDTMLAVSDYVIIDSVGACEAEYMIAVLEGMQPVLDTVTPMDTITDNHPTFEITFKGDVTFNSDVMGYLTVTPKDSSDALLTIEITESMVSGNTITVDYVLGEGELGLDKNTTYVVAIDSGVVIGDGLAWDGQIGYDWMFTTGSDWATGIENPATAVEFKVYPNPFNDHIKIENYDKLTRVVLTNIAGQRVLDIEYPSSEIRTGNLVTGVYVVTLIANDKIVKSERIIKR